MRWLGCLVLAACSFRPGQLSTAPDDGDIDAPADAAPDAPDALVVPQTCATNPDVLVCLSFDAPTLDATMPNEGTAPVSAQLTSVMRSAHDGGGAAEVTPASRIYIPGHASLTGVRTLEMWVRIDVAPANDGGRVGMIDADTSPSAMSFFYYRQAGPTYQMRFEIGVQRFVNHTVTLGEWVYLAEVCDNGTLISYIDGTQVDSLNVACNPGNAVPYGLIIGANNAQNGNKSDEMTGAIDGLRLWTVARTAAEICETSNRTDCP